jgi:hypothetical protein
VSLLHLHIPRLIACNMRFEQSKDCCSNWNSVIREKLRCIRFIDQSIWQVRINLESSTGWQICLKSNELDT